MIAATATLAMPRKKTRQKKAARPEGTRRRSSHSRTGTSAIATTSAAVTGRKNSAPARSAKGGRSAAPPRASAQWRPAAGRAGDAVCSVSSARSLDRFLEGLVAGRGWGVFVCHRGRQCPSEALAEKMRLRWCPRPDSNGHSLRNSILSSSASTNSATGARDRAP